jgi:hypothetical protein
VTSLINGSRWINEKKENASGRKITNGEKNSAR